MNDFGVRSLPNLLVKLMVCLLEELEGVCIAGWIRGASLTSRCFVPGVCCVFLLDT